MKKGVLSHAVGAAYAAGRALKYQQYYTNVKAMKSYAFFCVF